MLLKVDKVPIDGDVRLLPLMRLKCLHENASSNLRRTMHRRGSRNSKIENQIRPIGLGRKNYLFVGSHESAQRIAMIYPLLGTCKASGIDPDQWLTKVLEEIPDRTVNNLEGLLPLDDSCM